MYVRGELFLAAPGSICGVTIGPFPTTDRSADGTGIAEVTEMRARKAATNRHRKDGP